MSPLPVALIIVSCFSHAQWNLLARRHRGCEPVFFRRMLLLGIPVCAALGAVAISFSASLPPKALLCVLGSGLIAGLYFRFLALAYGAADFTTVYPVARALPVLVVAALDMLRGHYPTAIGWGGLLLVVLGCALAPQESYRGFSLRRYAARDMIWMLLTAAAVVGFTMIDKIGSEAVTRGPGSAALYCAAFYSLAGVSYLLLQAVFDRTPQDATPVGWRLPALSAVLGYGSYWLVLWAFQLATHTAYLLALRQFSIVIGVVAAFGIFKERGLAVRLPATAAIVAGLVLLVFYG